MARRTELKGICNDLLSAFISRNNNLDGYWTLSQCRAWLEEEETSTIKVFLVGKVVTNEKPQVAALSQYFNAALTTMLSRHKLNLGWVKNGYITITMENANQLQCSMVLISDLGRKFQSTRSLVVHSHDPSRELRRRYDDWGIRDKREYLLQAVSAISSILLK